MLLFTFYFILMVPFQVALDFDIFAEKDIEGENTIIKVIDLLASFWLIVDIPFRLRLGFIINYRGELELDRNLERT